MGEASFQSSGFSWYETPMKISGAELGGAFGPIVVKSSAGLNAATALTLAENSAYSVVGVMVRRSAVTPR